MAALFKSEAWIAIVVITDLLARKYRFNVPGTPANLNWTWPECGELLPIFARVVKPKQECV
jgi:hypothetical protein